jgi:hypothetical protein
MGIFLDLVEEYLGIQKAAHGARKPYRWGVKEYLSSFEVGEKRACDERFVWASIRSIASHMKKAYGVCYRFETKNNIHYITRIA